MNLPAVKSKLKTPKDVDIQIVVIISGEKNQYSIE